MVLKSTFEEEKMAHHNPKVDEEMVQRTLLDDPGDSSRRSSSGCSKSCWKPR